MLFDMFDVAAGECKAIGTPRTAEEAYAVRNLGIPAELVRKGILTLADMDIKTIKGEEKAVVTEPKEELEAPEVVAEPTTTEDVEMSELEAVQAEYKEKIGNLPPNKRKDITRLKNKLLLVK